jgi:hypothetical protein
MSFLLTFRETFYSRLDGMRAAESACRLAFLNGSIHHQDLAIQGPYKRRNDTTD